MFQQEYIKIKKFKDIWKNYNKDLKILFLLI